MHNFPLVLGVLKSALATQLNLVLLMLLLILIVMLNISNISIHYKTIFTSISTSKELGICLG